MGKKEPFKPSEYTIVSAVKDAARYNGGIYVGDNYVMKDHGNYIEVNVDADNARGHISFDVHYDDDGRITNVIPHKY